MLYCYNALLEFTATGLIITIYLSKCLIKTKAKTLYDIIRLL